MIEVLEVMPNNHHEWWPSHLDRNPEVDGISSGVNAVASDHAATATSARVAALMPWLADDNRASHLSRDLLGAPEILTPRRAVQAEL